MVQGFADNKVIFFSCRHDSVKNSSSPGGSNHLIKNTGPASMLAKFSRLSINPSKAESLSIIRSPAFIDNLYLLFPRERFELILCLLSLRAVGVVLRIN